jgi:hypothetical protein
VSLVLGVLPACQPERLVVIRVQAAKALDAANVSVSIALLEGRKGPDYHPTQHLDFTDHDAGTTIFPALLGIYLREQSGPLSVQVFGYGADDGAALAVGQRGDLMLNDERQQDFTNVAQAVALYPCKDNPLCGNSPPDGGDGGSDAEGGTAAPPSCTDYCKAAINLCSMLFPKGQPQCEASCVAARLGSNQLACLIHFIGSGPSPDHCPDVSLVGGICSSQANGCDAYCQFGSSVCGDQLFPPDCVTECVGQHLSVGSAESPRNDNSLLCRVSWLEDAIDNPDLCTHALPAGPCQAQ